MAGSKRGIEAGRAYVRASLDDSLFIKGIRRMKGGLVGFGKALPSIASGIYVFKQLGSVVSGVVDRVMESISDVATLSKTAKAFGATAEQASALFGVFKASGAENARENIESLVTLSGRIKDVLAGTGEETKKLFDGLSISAEQLAGLPIDEQFFRLHEAIMQLPDPMDRVNRLMLAFGEDGGKTLIGTLSMSTEELRKQAKGYEISAKEAEDANRAQAAMRKVTEAVAKAWQKVALTVAPVIVQVVDGLSKAAHWVTEWARQNAALQASLDALRTILNAIGAGAWVAAWKVGVAAAKLAFAQLIEWIKPAWLDVQESIALTWAAVEGAFRSSIDGMVGGFRTAIESLYAAWVVFADAMKRVWTDLWAGLSQVLGNSVDRSIALYNDAIASLPNAVRQGLNVVGMGKGFHLANKDEATRRGDEARQRIADRSKMYEDRRQARQDEIAVDTGLKLDGLFKPREDGAQRQRDIEDQIAADFARQRDALGGETAKAAKELADAMAAAKEETEKRTGAEAATPELPPAAEQAITKADTATNSAQILGTAEAQKSILGAITGVRDGDTTAAVKEGNKIARDQLKEQREMRRQGVVLAEAKTK